MEVPYNPPLERQVTENCVHLPPFPSSPPHQVRLGRDPLPPSTGHTPPPRKLPSRTSLGENLTSASKSVSEVTFLTQDDRKEHSGKTAPLYEVR